jgi:hypothetical protein
MTITQICRRPRASSEHPFNVVLIQTNMSGAAWQVEYALLGGGHAMKDAQKQPPLLSRLRRGLFRGKSSTKTATF